MRSIGTALIHAVGPLEGKRHFLPFSLLWVLTNTLRHARCCRLRRQSDGSFKSNELAHILQEATSTIACGFGPRGIPAVLKPVEVMGIEQARKWGVCTLNEFRQFMGLRKFKTFEEWCGVSDVAVRLSFFSPPFESACIPLSDRSLGKY